VASDNFLAPGEPIDLTNCDREPIHVPGSVQPHGVLLVLSGTKLAVFQASESAAAVLGVAAADLLGRPLDALLEPAAAHSLAAAALNPGLDANPLHLFTAPVCGRPCDAIIHHVGDALVLELEPAPDGAERADSYALVRRAVTRIQAASTLDETLSAAAEEVRRISGFDRVMVYRFDPDGHGSVVAEARREDVEPFLGLHYPASDIPRQARRLYTLNLLRLIADVNYAPAPLVSMPGLESSVPLDMSHCVLRSVSPIHVQYLKNMGVSASMSISILQGGELWGLIACHHYAPRFVPYDGRTACEFLGQVVSLQVAARQDAADLARRVQIRGVQARLIEFMADDAEYQDGLTRHDLTLLDLVGAGGAAVCAGGAFRLLGKTPAETDLTRLVDWLAEAGIMGDDGVFATDGLSALFQAAEAYKDVASGLLTVAVSPAQRHWALWFRPEVLQMVNWAGDPNKPAEAAPDGTPRLSPRGSFALWRETVRGRSLPWEPTEVEAAREFRRALVGVVLRQAEELARANARLARSNEELDAFAYIASHDLKEPLRGIRNYSEFLKEDYADALGEEGRAQLDTLARLTRRMESLLDSLLHYSRVGQLLLNLRETDMNAILRDALEALHPRIEETGVEVRVPRPLPPAVCDELQTGEVFSNLLSNAVKYNNKAQRWVEVGCLDGPAPTVFYVRDNGIGIRERHLDAIFRIFKRLHGRDDYGGGTGAGLTIARKVVERHGGRLWVESALGEGTTFYFTLAPREGLKP
jgi:chemotaxis family two-component system sensor kinase Cph1